VQGRQVLSRAKYPEVQDATQSLAWRSCVAEVHVMHWV
jgi:hypothetical protein